MTQAIEATRCIEGISVDDLQSRTDLIQYGHVLSQDDQEVIETMNVVQTLWYQEKRPLQGYAKPLQMFKDTSNKVQDFNEYSQTHRITPQIIEVVRK